MDGRDNNKCVLIGQLEELFFAGQCRGAYAFREGDGVLGEAACLDVYIVRSGVGNGDAIFADEWAFDVFECEIGAIGDIKDGAFGGDGGDSVEGDVIRFFYLSAPLGRDFYVLEGGIDNRLFDESADFY